MIHFYLLKPFWLNLLLVESFVGRTLCELTLLVIISIREMNKVLITAEPKHSEDTLEVSLEQAPKLLPALKENHFQSVTIEALGNTKCLLYIPRILQANVPLSTPRDNSSSTI